MNGQGFATVLADVSYYGIGSLGSLGLSLPRLLRAEANANCRVRPVAAVGRLDRSGRAS